MKPPSLSAGSKENHEDPELISSSRLTARDPGLPEGGDAVLCDIEHLPLWFLCLPVAMESRAGWDPTGPEQHAPLRAQGKGEHWKQGEH